MSYMWFCVHLVYVVLCIDGVVSMLYMHCCVQMVLCTNGVVYIWCSVHIVYMVLHIYIVVYILYMSYCVQFLHVVLCICDIFLCVLCSHYIMTCIFVVLYFMYVDVLCRTPGVGACIVLHIRCRCMCYVIH